MTVVRQAVSDEDFEGARRLLREYGAALSCHLCLPAFEAEIRGLPGDYALPRGAFLLAMESGEPVGCAALGPLEGAAAEMKRLYVRPSSRRLGLGRQLVLGLIEAARARGYARLCLDTAPSMVEAGGLYRSLGFIPIDPYRPEPTPCALHFALDLRSG